MAAWLFIKKWWGVLLGALAALLYVYSTKQKAARESAELERAAAEARTRAAQSAKDAVTAQRAAERLAVDTHEAAVYKATIDADVKMAALEKKEDELPGPDASTDKVADAWNKRLTDITK